MCIPGWRERITEIFLINTRSYLFNHKERPDLVKTHLEQILENELRHPGHFMRDKIGYHPIDQLRCQNMIFEWLWRAWRAETLLGPVKEIVRDNCENTFRAACFSLQDDYNKEIETLREA